MIREPDPPPGSAPERTDAEAIRTAVAELARKLGPATPDAAPTATVRRVSIRRAEGDAAPTDEDEDIFAAPGTAEPPARVTTRSGAPTPVRAAAGFRPSRWIPGVGVVLLLVAGAAWWGGLVPRQQGTEVGIPAATPAAPATKAATPATPPSAPSATTPAAAPPPPASGAAPQVATAPPPAPSPAAPSFDIVRVSPDGRTVVAGRAAPGSKVTVLDGERELATVQADPRGEWVAVLDQPLQPGGHELRILQQVGDQPAVPSDRTVAVAVPPASSTTSTPPSAPLVVSTPTSRGPSTVLQAPGGTETLARSGALVLGAVDYDDQGYMALSGTAPAGTTVRVYVDNKVMGEATAGADRRWSLLPTETIPLGKRTVRVDQLDGSGSVTQRLEVPFERVAMAKPGAVTIVRGDNLWTIARNRYGDGGRYTVIYEANKGQIRDPNLIYPGQIFVVPKSP
jgi:nucleoid-associated protein YgaU